MIIILVLAHRGEAVARMTSRGKRGECEKSLEGLVDRKTGEQ